MGFEPLGIQVRKRRGENMIRTFSEHRDKSDIPYIKDAYDVTICNIKK
ncbi:MAG: hypothetical protein LBU81_00920 [Methanosarcinales archaeon]|jgi:hypothetical protein|nr:hypothetical protein [Methanosarcinales archaeon]